MKLRTARIETDLPKIVQIMNPYESNPVTPERVRSWFQYSPPGRVQLRLVAADEQDTVTGYSGFVHEASAPAGHYIVWVIVDPDSQGFAERRGFAIDRHLRDSSLNLANTRWCKN